MTPGQEIARRGVARIDDRYFWKGQQKRLAAAHETLELLAASQEEPLASSARALQVMARSVAADADSEQALSRRGLEAIATLAAEQAASPTSYVAAIALRAADGLPAAQAVALEALPAGTTLESEVLGTSAQAGAKLAMLAEPSTIWTRLPETEMVPIAHAELKRDGRPAAQWLRGFSEVRALRAGLQADLQNPQAVALAVHRAAPLQLAQLQGLGCDAWLNETLTDGQRGVWIDALLSAPDHLAAAASLALDPGLADKAHRVAVSEVLAARPELAESLSKLREMSQRCGVAPEASRAVERTFLSGSAASSPGDLAALLEEHAEPDKLHALLLEAYAGNATLKALPSTPEGEFALSAALDGLRANNPERAIKLALGRLARAQDKLAVLSTSQNPLVVRLAAAETTPWTRVRAATAALDEAGSVLKAGVRALETCQEPEQEQVVGDVVTGLLQEQWGSSPVLARYFERLKTGDLVAGLKELAQLEEQGVLQLVAGRPTGSIEETREGVIVGGVVLPKRSE